MKSGVTIDGITLTRGQIERAMKELNTSPIFKGGDIVSWPKRQSTFLVLDPDGAIAKFCIEKYSFTLPLDQIRVTDGRDTYTPLIEDLTLVSKL